MSYRWPDGAPRVMGILNLTPDSFSDGGRLATVEQAIRAGEGILAAGADILDIGAESTRPGAGPVDPAAEQDRLLPVVRALAARAVVSVDTRNAATMAACLAAGAAIVNDVSGLTHDPAAAAVVARAGCGVVLMHMRGDPATMAGLSQYGDVVADVTAELAARIVAAEQAGVARGAIAVDPGIGFAKTPAQSMALLANLAALGTLGCPVVVGTSRKRFIAAITGDCAPGERLGGSIATALMAIERGAAVVRVHDVAETVQAVRLWRGGLAGARNCL